jgi:mycothiol synthase
MEGLEVGVVTEPTAALRAAVEALIERVERTRGHAPLSEHKRMVLARSAWGGGGDAEDPGDDRLDFGIIATAAGGTAPLGYAQASGDRSTREYAVELLVEPATDGNQVAAALTGATVDQVAASGGGALRLWVPRASPTDDDLARRHGFSPERELIQMRCPLPLPAPPNASAGASGGQLPLRSFRPGRDEPAWLVSNNRAFASHPEQGDWDLGTLVEREHEPWFNPAGFLVLEADGRMAGSCWTKVHAHTTPPMGEIYVIGVDPDYHGRGWGRALTRAGLEWLADQGLTVGMLYVDADNRAAVHLYRSMGFTEDHVDRSYLRNVD